jgi:hypothetical protein
MHQIKHRVGIKCTATKLYQLLVTDVGLSRWWTTDTSGAGDIGSIIHFKFGDDGPRFEVIELTNDALVRWRHTGNMPQAWMGSEVCFEIEERSDQTILNFSHYNWQVSDSFLAHCSTKWAVFMISIKACLETGKGRPFPDDLHIDFDE